MQHEEVVGRVQDSQAGLGWGEPVQFWSKATREQQEIMVAEVVTRLEQECYFIRPNKGHGPIGRTPQAGS